MSTEGLRERVMRAMREIIANEFMDGDGSPTEDADRILSLVADAVREAPASYFDAKTARQMQALVVDFIESGGGS